MKGGPESTTTEQNILTDIATDGANGWDRVDLNPSLWFSRCSREVIQGYPEWVVAKQ